VKIAKDLLNSVAQTALNERDLVFPLSVPFLRREPARCFFPPYRLPFQARGIGEGADGEDAVPPAAVQQHQAGIVQRAQLAKAVVGMPEDRAIKGLVQQPPDDNARMAAVAGDDASIERS